jgi:putative colanic acid biosynthesis acetyltransferase WcaF
MSEPLHTHVQDTQWSSPWSSGERWKLLLWELLWPVLCAWTPKPFNPWRLLVLQMFGARIEGTPFVHQRARVQMPWKLILRHRACLGDGAVAYSLGVVDIGEGATVSQEAYLCTGTHDFSSPVLPLQTAPVVIGPGAFIGARAFILPGIRIGARAVVGACSVVTRDVPDGVRVAGNPARILTRKPA